MIDERALRMMAMATKAKPLSTRQVAECLGCSPRYVRRLVAKGKLHPYNVGRGYLFDEDEVRRVRAK